jgi:hypothetical protein
VRRPDEITGNANPERHRPMSVACLRARKEHHDRRAKDGQNEKLGKSGMSAAGRDVVCGLCCALDHLWPHRLRIDHAFSSGTSDTRRFRQKTAGKYLGCLDGVGQRPPGAVYLFPLNQIML